MCVCMNAYMYVYAVCMCVMSICVGACVCAHVCKCDKHVHVCAHTVHVYRLCHGTVHPYSTIHTCTHTHTHPAKGEQARATPHSLLPLTLRSVYFSSTLCSLNRHSRPVAVSVYVVLERRPRPQATATKQLSCRSPSNAERPFNGSAALDWGGGRTGQGNITLPVRDKESLATVTFLLTHC